MALKSELQILQRVQHPNIIQYVGPFRLEMEEDSSNTQSSTNTGADGPCIGYVMELCTQGTLAALITDVGFFDELSAAWLIRDALSALAYLHARRIVHRDVKAANLLFKAFSLKLADFGAAIHPFGADDRREKLQGTFLYLPPEAVLEKRFGPPMDVWAVGCVALEMLALSKGNLNPKTQTLSPEL